MGVQSSDVFSYFYFYAIGTGKYSDEPTRSDEWFVQGKMVFIILLPLF